MHNDNWVWVDITADDWAALRDIWTDMMASWPEAFLETVADLEAMSERQWRERAVALSADACFAQAILGDDGTWWGFLSAYIDDVSRERNAFVTHVHVRSGHPLEGALIERLLQWASRSFVEAVVLEVRDDHHEVLARYRSYGFDATGAARHSECDDRHDELELARALDDGGADDIRWRRVVAQPMSA